jgi:hypothetical protein
MRMKALKIAGVVGLVYLSFVLIFETVVLGIYQPSLEDPDGCAIEEGRKTLRTDCGVPMIKITTFDNKGESSDRMLARFRTDGKLYISAHHWTRGWYKAALKNPNVRAEISGQLQDYIAVPIEGEEFRKVSVENPIPTRMWFMMGMPPKRQILRLDPVSP